MVYSEFCRENLSGYKMNDQAHAFVDQNLQIQIPGSSDTNEKNSSSHSIYTYFTPALNLHPTFSTKEEELLQAMNEANQTYAAWKKMKDQLQQVALKYFN